MKKLIIIVTIISLSLVGFNSRAMALSPASIFGNSLGQNNAHILKTCANESGENAINCILELVVDILSIGIGILGVIGISVSGIQYLTAGGNEEKTRKAKRRIFEIVIGIVAYVLIYAALKWLMPGY